MLANLEGLVPVNVGLRLAALAQRVPANQAIVEIGSFKGRSACYMAEGSKLGKRAPVICVDRWDEPGNVNDDKNPFSEPETFQKFLDQVKLMGHDDLIDYIQGHGAWLGNCWNGEPVGLLFIDGSHVYDDVLADFDAWEPHVTSGGFIVFDDFGGKRNRGVDQAIETIRELHPEFSEWDFDTEPLAIVRKP